MTQFMAQFMAQFMDVKKRTWICARKVRTMRLAPSIFKRRTAPKLRCLARLAAVVPRLLEHNREPFEAAERDIGKELIAVTEMAVGRGRADPGPARRVGKGEAGRAVLLNEVEGGGDQRLAQIAVVVAAAPARPFFRPVHVNGFYIICRSRSTGGAEDRFTRRA